MYIYIYIYIRTLPGICRIVIPQNTFSLLSSIHGSWGHHESKGRRSWSCCWYLEPWLCSLRNGHWKGKNLVYLHILCLSLVLYLPMCQHFPKLVWRWLSVVETCPLCVHSTPNQKEFSGLVHTCLVLHWYCWIGLPEMWLITFPPITTKRDSVWVFTSLFL